MTDWSSNVQDLHPPGDRLALRGQAAELLIQATDPALAGRALFDLIAAELKLNVFLLYAPGDQGRFDLIAHGGLSQAEAVTAAAEDPPACGGGEPPGPAHLTGVQGRDDDGMRSIGLRAYFGQPLMAGERLLGILGFGRRWADGFDEEDLAFLQNVAHYFALALGRLRGEAALREGEQRLRLGMTVAGFGTLDHDLITGRLVMSPEVCAIMGWSPDQPVTPETLRATQLPDDRERLLAARLASYDPEGAAVMMRSIG